MLRFLWWFMVLTPLPIELWWEKGSQACLYIPMVGWAIFGARSILEISPRALTRVLEREPWGQELSGLHWSGRAADAIGVFLWARQNREYKRTHAAPVMASLGHEAGT